MHSMGYPMLKKSSILKIIDNVKTYNKPIFLDSGFIFYVDETKPNLFIILNIDDIQNIINKITNMTDVPQYNNCYEDLIDGHLSFKQPIVNSERYEISVKNYKEMNNSLPRELLKVFKFKKFEDNPTNLWFNL